MNYCRGSSIQASTLDFAKGRPAAPPSLINTLHLTKPLTLRCAATFKSDPIRPVCICLALLMGGCVSLPVSPSLMLTTDKSAQKYAQCVHQKLDAQGLATTIKTHHGRRTVIVKTLLSGDQILDAYKTSTTTEISLYAHLGSTSAGLVNAAKECR